MKTVELNGRKFSIMENVTIFKGTDKEQTFGVADEELEDVIQEAIENDGYNEELNEISSLYLWVLPLEELEMGYDNVVEDIEAACEFEELRS